MSGDQLPKTLQEALDAVVGEHGGYSALDTAQLLTCRALVRVLAEMSAGDTSKASSIVALQGMLPAKAEAAGGKAFDISRLTDRQVGIFERLLAVGCGDEPQREHRCKSSHHWNAMQAVALLDKFFKRVASPDEDHKYQIPRALIATESNPTPVGWTDRERVELRSCLDALLDPLRIVDLYV
jgi:hypothetical protein